KRGFPGTVLTDQTNPVAPHDHAGKVSDDRRRARIGKSHVLGLDHELAGFARLVQPDTHLALDLAPLGPFLPQPLKRPHPTLVACPPGLDTLPNPDLLLRQLFIEQIVVTLPLSEPGLLSLQEPVVIAGPGRQMSAIKLEQAGRHTPQEGPVVRDE